MTRKTVKQHLYGTERKKTAKLKFHTGEISFKSRGEIKTLSYTQKLKESLTRRPVL